MAKSSRERDRRKNLIAAGKTAAPTPSVEVLKAQAAVAHQMQLRHTSGPLPSAEQLAQYEAILPGIAERMMRVHESQVQLVERQVNHRIEIENRVISGDSKRSWAGLIIGGAVTVIGFVGCYSLAMHGRELTAIVGAATELTSIVAIFVHGTNSRRAERQSRLDVLVKDSTKAPQKNDGQMALPHIGKS